MSDKYGGKHVGKKQARKGELDGNGFTDDDPSDVNPAAQSTAQQPAVFFPGPPVKPSTPIVPKAPYPAYNGLGTLILTVGLPMSGKSTWAREYAREHFGAVVAIDSFRKAFHGRHYIKECEQMIWSQVRIMVRALFLGGHPLVILDSPNIHREQRGQWKTPEWQTLFKVFHTDVEVCKERAREAGREDAIPTIERMYTQWEPIYPNDQEVP